MARVDAEIESAHELLYKPELHWQINNKKTEWRPVSKKHQWPAQTEEALTGKISLKSHGVGLPLRVWPVE